MTHTHTLILGASVLGAGLARALTARGVPCLILEKGILAGEEFANALHGAGAPCAGARSPEAADFLAELARRNIAAAGEPAHLPALQPVLCRRLREAGIPVLLSARLRDAAAADGGYLLDVHTPGGFVSVRARHIIDTTAACLGGRFFGVTPPPPARTAIACTLLAQGGEPTQPLPALPGAEVRPGRWPTLCSAHLPLPAGTPVDEALRQMDALCRQQPLPAGWTPGVCAFALDITPGAARLEAAEYTWLPSAYYADCVSAYDAGVAEGERGRGQ